MACSLSVAALASIPRAASSALVDESFSVAFSSVWVVSFLLRLSPVVASILEVEAVTQHEYHKEV
jgi:hypothetical protein